MAPLHSLPVLAQVATAFSTDPMQLFDTTWLPILLGIVQVASLVFLVIYVIKTVEIAEANRQAAEATQKTTEATLLSVRLSEQAVEEMRAARDAQTAPYVVVYLDMHVSGLVMMLVMENLGQTAAHDISLTFDPELDAKLRFELNEKWPRFMTEITPTLAPKQRIHTALNYDIGLLASREIESSYTVSVSYRGGMTDGVQETERRVQFALDFLSFQGVMQVSENDVKKAVGHLEKLTAAVKNLQKPLDDMEERLDRGIFATPGLSTFTGADHDLGGLSTAMSLVATLKTSWRLIEDKNRAQMRVPATDRQLALRTIEQIPALLSSMRMSRSRRERAQAIASELASLASQHFRRGLDVEPKIFPLLDELEALIQAEINGVREDSDAESVNDEGENPHAQQDDAP